MVALPPKACGNSSNFAYKTRTLSLSCLTNHRQQSHLHLNLKSSVSLKLPAMILATILFVFSAGSAVLADECKQEKQFSFDVPFNLLPENFVYCATRVTGQNKQFCGLKFVSRPTLADPTTVLNGTYYDESGTGGYYTFNLTKEFNGPLGLGGIGVLGTKYATTTVPSIEGQTITAYVTNFAGLLTCMTYVKCFQGGPWAGSEDSGTFTAVVCPKQEDCKNILTGKNLVNALNSTAGPELMEPDWDKCPK